MTHSFQRQLLLVGNIGQFPNSLFPQAKHSFHKQCIQNTYAYALTHALIDFIPFCRELNRDLHVHKGSPPNHPLDGSPRSIGSNSSSNSSASENSLSSIGLNNTLVKYYHHTSASVEGQQREGNTRGRGGIGTAPIPSVPIPIPNQMQAAVMAHTEVRLSV